MVPSGMDNFPPQDSHCRIWRFVPQPCKDCEMVSKVNSNSSADCPSLTALTGATYPQYSHAIPPVDMS